MNPSLRAAVIAEWRGLPEKKTRTDRWQASADVLPRLMQRDRRRIYRRAFDANGATGRRSLRAGPPTGFALRIGTSFQDGNLAKVKKTLRRQDHPRHPLPRRLNSTADYAD